ncbi:iron transport multicopper oxidase FET3 [Apiospora saccharicola]|uniref:Iron transport multicopper oxidase FET3 n=1 Tax=Apiospora saccharicola TaxID=335842 RepID=A0ABR1UXT9_9PEZI
MRAPLSSLLLLPLASAKTLEYYWDISWKYVAPDGFGRSVVTVNNQWPPPAIDGMLGDRVIVHVSNSLGNESTGIHWHGIQQVGTNQMDGPVGVTQCPIPPGSRFTYNFPVTQAGTYWWHAHIEGQIADGLRGPMTFKDPHAPYNDKIDGERTITLGDWYHTQAPFLIEQYESAENACRGKSSPLLMLPCQRLAMFDSIPPNYNPHFYGYLVCDEHKPLPEQNPITDLTVVNNIDFVTSTYNPWIDQAEVYEHVGHQIVFTMDFTTIDNQNGAIIDNVTYVPQKVPTLHTALTVGSYADSHAAVYGQTNPLLIKSGDVVEVVIKNHDLEACRRLGIPTKGNAAGNTRDPLDLTGANTQPPPHPMGALVNASALQDPHRPRKGHPAWPHWPKKGHHHHKSGYRV